MKQINTVPDSAMLFPAGCAIVVGGSGGIGSAIALTLARHSPVVVTWRNNHDAAQQVVAQIRSAGGEALACRVDSLDLHSIRQCLSDACREYGAIHTLVNAAGSNIRMRFIAELAVDEWTQVMNADANGFFHWVREVLPHLRHTRGSVVQVSSIGLSRWPKQDVLSVAPKAAIEALIRGIAKEEGRYGVRANSIQLGVIDAGIFHRLKGTDFSEKWVEAARENTALKRFGSAEDIAEAVLFLASRQSAYTTGQSLCLDGGFAL